MVRGQNQKVLSLQELENIRDERRELESSLKEAEGFGSGTGREVNRAVISSQIKKLQEAERAGSAHKLSGADKDRMAKRASELEEQFSAGMPTKWEMDHPAKCPGAVKKHLAWLRRNEHTGAVEEYRQIQRQLNPGEEQSIERLRKEK